jgi:hypothetical protein
MKFWSQDESRLGLLPIIRRRITGLGVQPIKQAEYNFENFYLYGLTEILSGEKFFLELPYVNGECFKLFMEEFLASEDDQTFHIIFLDNALVSLEKLSQNGKKRRVYQLSAIFAGVESDRAVLAGCQGLVSGQRNQKLE